MTKLVLTTCFLVFLAMGVTLFLLVLSGGV